MTKTIPINARELTLDFKSSFGGTDGDIFPSPYDIPQAVVINNDHGHDSMEIRFRYISDEPANRMATRTSAVFLYLGKKSRRIYRIEIDLWSLKELTGANLSDGTSAIVAAISELDSDLTNSHRKFNYQIIQSILKEIGPGIFGLPS